MDRIRPGPPILSVPPSKGRIHQVDKKYSEFLKLEISEPRRQEITHLVDDKFARAATALGATLATERREPSGASVDQQAILESLSLLRDAGAKTQPVPSLSPDLLIEINRIATGADTGLRTNKGPEHRSPAPIPPMHIAYALDSACQWFKADSFVELHPIEQASVVQLRLLEIYPFESANEVSALIAASLYPISKGLPPIVISEDYQDRYLAAIVEGLKMNTGPLVEVLAACLYDSLDEMYEIGSGSRS